MTRALYRSCPPYRAHLSRAAEAVDSTLAAPNGLLNLMFSDGRGTMASARPGKAWAEDFAQRGLFTRVPGRLVPEQGEPVALPANSLLWQSEASSGAWRFEPEPAVPESATVAWWLAYSPEGNRVSS